MKKIIVMLLVAAIALGLVACGGEHASSGAESVELIVFAAASMTETLTELGEQYMAEHPEVKIIFNFDSSGTLKTQIQEGAVCDIFISAGQKQMNELDCLLEGTRFDILENKVALAVPEGNPAGIESYDEMIAGLEEGTIMLAMGNADVPVGQYTQKILASYGLEEAALAAAGSVTYGTNVKEIATQISEGIVDCGIIYQTDAFSAGLTVVFNFDSSGTLKTQIQEGADVDIFISAGQKQMNQLDITADASINTEGLDFVLEGTRFDILENKVALAVPDNNPAGINSYDDLIAGLKDASIMLAMGNADVPVGQYTQKILSYYGLVEEELAAAGSITYGTNVKEVTTQVSEAAVDCGIIYQTDAFSAGLTVVDTATAEMCGQVIYPAAVLNISENIEAAEDFLEFLASDAADAVFTHVGFTPMN